jgi:hypothetical protein
MNDNVRYWDRVGMYVTKEFAEEWIERVNAQDGDSAGRYLADDIDEYEDSTIGASAGQLRKEIEKLFEEDFKEVELPPSTITQGIEEIKSYSIPDYNSLEVFELKNLLKQRGHETKGRKAELVKRLIEFDVSMIPLDTPSDRITYGENNSELVEALLNGRREEEE